jgi:hypothetical protein
MYFQGRLWDPRYSEEQEICPMIGFMNIIQKVTFAPPKNQSDPFRSWIFFFS